MSSNNDNFRMKIDRELTSKRVLICKNLILDVLLNRQVYHLENAIYLLDLMAEEKIKGYISQSDWNDISSFINLFKSRKDGSCLLESLDKIFEVIPLNWEIFDQANSDNFSDLNLNHAFLAACAEQAKIDAVVIENSKELSYQIGNIKIIDINRIDLYIDWLTSTNFGQEEARVICDEAYQHNSSNKKSEKIIIADWIIEDFQIKLALNCYSQAKLTLRNSYSEESVQREASGEGAIEAICQALYNALSSYKDIPCYELNSIRIGNIYLTLSSQVSGTVILKSGANYYKGHAVDKDSVVAGFYAYAEALNNLLTDNQYQSSTAPNELYSTKLFILSAYTEGERNFIQASLAGENLSEQNLSDINLSKANLENTQIHKSILIRSNFSKADLSNANLSLAILREANLQDAILYKARLQEATLHQAKLQKANLRKADFTKADLKEANLSGADLTKTDLTGANLSGANLNDVKVDETNLNNANLNRAKLGQDGVDLRKVTLENAHLEEIEPDYEILKIHTLEKQLEELTPFEQNSLETFRQLLQKVELSQEFLLKFVSFNDKHFARKLLLRKNNLTVYVIGWKPEQEVGPHHHGASLDAIRVIKGKMTHWQFSKINKYKSKKEDLGAIEGCPNQMDYTKKGDEIFSTSGLIFIDRWTMHQIKNDSGEDLVTLHFRYGCPPDEDDQNWVSEKTQSGLTSLA